MAGIRSILQSPTHYMLGRDLVSRGTGYGGTEGGSELGTVVECNALTSGIPWPEANLVTDNFRQWSLTATARVASSGADGAIFAAFPIPTGPPAHMAWFDIGTALSIAGYVRTQTGALDAIVGESGPTVSLNTMYALTLLRIGATAELWVNGLLIGTDTVNDPGANSYTEITAIGTEHVGTADRRLNGAVGMVASHHYPLSGQQIADLHGTLLAGPLSTAEDYWPLAFDLAAAGSETADNKYKMGSQLVYARNKSHRI